MTTCNTDHIAEALLAVGSSGADLESVASTLFTDLLLACNDSAIDVDATVSVLSHTIHNDLLARVFCQVLGTLPNSPNLDKLLSHIVDAGNIIKTHSIATHLGQDFLRDLGVVPRESFIKSLNIASRDHFYTQNKYNLLHEEIDGYAKLYNDLFHAFRREPTHNDPATVFSIVSSLIGHYNLDPNRCLFVFLQVSSAFLPQFDFVLKVLKTSPWWPHTRANNTRMDLLSAGGNLHAAKALGLHIVRYPVDQTIPEQFMALIACLIKAGFVSFGLIWPYVASDEEALTQLQAQVRARLETEASRAGASALALAAPLLDDEDDSHAAATPVNKPHLRSSTPAPSTIPTSLDSRIASHPVMMLLNQMLAIGLYQPSLFILKLFSWLVDASSHTAALINRLGEQSVNPLYELTLSFAPNSLLKSLRLPKKILHYSTKHYTFDALDADPNTVFFYSSWAEGVPEIRTVEELFSYCDDFLKFSSVHLAQSPSLLQKICRIGCWALELDTNNTERERWFHFIRNYIFPSILLMGENSIVVDQVFKLLSLFPVSDRYCWYGELYQVLAKNTPHLRIAYCKTEKATKDLLKRLSKENVSQMMRRLAKLSVANPLPCFLVILQQIESYDNLISLVVDAARYFTAYGWDMLTAAILMRLTATGRSATQQNGMDDRRWLQSLASFIGRICERYPTSIDLPTLLSFLLKTFHSGDYSILVVLKEIFISMGGMQVSTNLTARQVNMIEAGASLEKIVYNNIGDARYSRTTSTNVLISCFQQLDAVNELFVLLRNMHDHQNLDNLLLHLKVVTARSDDVHIVARLFTALVSFSGKDQNLRLVPIGDFVEKYGVDLPWAFELWRPVLMRDFIENGLRYTSDRWQELLRTVSSNFNHQWAPEQLKSTLLISFWVLSLHDINYCEELYTQERLKLEAFTKNLLDFLDISVNDKEVPRMRIQQAQHSVADNKSLLREIEPDQQKHKTHDQSIDALLSAEAPLWFTGSDEEVRLFLQHCILPRSIHSAFDAIFSARFLFKLHELNVEGFSLLKTLDKLLEGRILFGTLFTLTPVESENHGLFFAEILGTMIKWTNHELYVKVAKGLQTENNMELAFDGYREKLLKYHSALLEQLELALSNTNYMCRQNGIIFMKNLLGVYPVVEDHCERILELIQNIVMTEDREDLKLSSSALSGHIKSKSKEWVHMWDFVPMTAESKDALIAKRKEALAKAKLLEDETRKKQLLARQEAEKAQKLEEEERKRQNLLDYDSGVPKAPIARESRVGASGLKGRYDNYSNFTSRPAAPSAHTRESTPSLKQRRELGPTAKTTASSAIGEGFKSKAVVPNAPHANGSDSKIDAAKESSPTSGADNRDGEGKIVSSLEQEKVATEAKEQRQLLSQGVNAQTPEQSNSTTNVKNGDHAEKAVNTDEQDTEKSALPDKPSKMAQRLGRESVKPLDEKTATTTTPLTSRVSSEKASAKLETQSGSPFKAAAQRGERPSIKEKLLEAKQNYQNAKSETLPLPQASKRTPLPPQTSIARGEVLQGSASEKPRVASNQLSSGGRTTSGRNHDSGTTPRTSNMPRIAALRVEPPRMGNAAGAKPESTAPSSNTSTSRVAPSRTSVGGNLAPPPLPPPPTPPPPAAKKPAGGALPFSDRAENASNAGRLNGRSEAQGGRRGSGNRYGDTKRLYSGSSYAGRSKRSRR